MAIEGFVHRGKRTLGTDVTVNADYIWRAKLIVGIAGVVQVRLEIKSTEPERVCIERMIKGE